MGGKRRTEAVGSKTTDQSNGPLSPLTQLTMTAKATEDQVPVEVIALLSTRVGFIKEIGCHSRERSAGSSKLEQEVN